MQNRSRCGFVEAASRQKEGKDEMIISASRRTDIPACYGQWMMARLRAGEVLVPNPYNASRISRVALSPGNVDCIVFWTKNAAPMLPLLDELDALGYKYYFEYTVTGYGSALEPGLPEKARTVDTFLRLSERLGPEGVDWRFDPVLLTSSITPAWQLERFGALCRALHGATRRCVFSFADPYPGIRSSIAPLEETQMRLLAKGFADIAGEYGLPLYTCAETVELSEYGIRHAACIDSAKVERIAGYPIRVERDPGQRPACGCAASVDVGVYNTCPNGCTYCYATTRPALLRRARAVHAPDAPMLTGWPRGGEQITDRTGPSLRAEQTSLFDNL